MDLIRGIDSVNRTLPRVVLTIGNFDGVHLGHQKIIRLAVSKARERAGTCAAFTFRPHPRAVLHPETKLDLLTTYDEKQRLLAGLGVDALIEEPFGREFSVISPEDFFNRVIRGRLNAEAIVIGYDFGFGKDRRGDLSTLETLCRNAGIELTVVPQQNEGGEVISSSAIRRHLLAGEMENAARLLGRNFSYQGTVIRGEGRGRKIGFPTANLRLEEKLALPYGVYATWAVVDSLKVPSVTNVGVRPTFRPTGEPELPALVETHLLGVTLDLYGKTLEVGFVRKLRDERKFAGIDALKEQIKADAELARSVLGG